MKSSNTLVIEGWKINTHIGVTDTERESWQDIGVSLELTYTDQLPAYTEIRSIIQNHMLSVENKLVEKLAHELSDLVLSNFDLEKVIVKIEKFGIVPDTRSVGVIVERES